MDMADTAVIPYSPPSSQTVGMVMPLATPHDAALAIDAYEQLKSAIVRPDDVHRIQGRDFLKKSFWRRVATCFGLSLDLVNETRGFDESGRLFYSVLYRAVAPNGRTMIGDGYCGTAEAGHGAWPEHNVRATAHTRAKNRAISDLVGGGEVSAEELGEEVFLSVKGAPAAAQPVASRPRRTETWPLSSTAHTYEDCRELSERLGYDHPTFRAGVSKYNHNGGAEAMYKALLVKLHERDDVVTDPDEYVAAAEAAGALPAEPEAEQEAQQPQLVITQEEALVRLHMKANTLGYSKAQWDGLVEDCHGDLDVIAQALEHAAQTDLRGRKSKAGVH